MGITKVLAIVDDAIADVGKQANERYAAGDVAGSAAPAAMVVTLNDLRSRIVEAFANGKPNQKRPRKQS